jgi:2-dehydropantoate 2-reductase
MRADGLRLISNDGEIRASVRAIEDPAEADEQDVVFVTTKAHALPPLVTRLLPLLGASTPVVTAMNGVPYWYFYRLEGNFPQQPVVSVDPGGVIWRTLGPERAIGCIVYPSAEVTLPGVVHHIEGDRFAIGEPDGTSSDRVATLSRMLIQAGFKAPVRQRIRDELWVKLWGNLAFNPLSALTGATLDALLGDPDIRAIARAMMVEAKSVAERLGVQFPIDVDRRIAGAARIVGHKTSMLQDLERGRPMEIDALVTAVQELAAIVEMEIPTINLVASLVRQRARLAGCYPA